MDDDIKELGRRADEEFEAQLAEYVEDWTNAMRAWRGRSTVRERL